MNYKIKVNSKKHSRKVQRLLFKLGNKWRNSGTEIVKVYPGRYIYSLDNQLCDADEFSYAYCKEYTIKDLERIVCATEETIYKLTGENTTTLHIHTFKEYDKYTIDAQVNKILEEVEEVAVAVKNGDMVNLFEELCDTIQSCHTATKILEYQLKALGNKNDVIQEQWEKHNHKLRDRGVI